MEKVYIDYNRKHPIFENEPFSYRMQDIKAKNYKLQQIRKWYIKFERKYHRKLKPRYRCPISGCKKSYIHFGSLKNHMWKLSNIKMYRINGLKYIQQKLEVYLSVKLL